MKEIEKMNDSSVYEKEEYGRRGWESERKRTRKTRERERECGGFGMNDGRRE